MNGKKNIELNMFYAFYGTFFPEALCLLRILYQQNNISY